MGTVKIIISLLLIILTFSMFIKKIEDAYDMIDYKGEYINKSAFYIEVFKAGVWLFLFIIFLTAIFIKFNEV